METKQYTVMHVSKLKLGGIGAHIDRKHISPNVNEEYVLLNKEFVSFPIEETLKQSADRRIKEGYTSSRKIRKDAVKIVGVILSGSHRRMHELVTEGRINEWAKANKEWAEQRFGKENILRFTLHMDELTPHIHCVFTPITPDGRLNYKHFVPNKRELIKMQDEYADKMASFGLLRGQKSTETKRKHTTTAEWYKDKNKGLKSLKMENENLREENKFLEGLAADIPPLITREQELQFDYEEAVKELEEHKSKHKSLVNKLVKLGNPNNTDEKIAKEVRDFRKIIKDNEKELER